MKGKIGIIGFGFIGSYYAEILVKKGFDIIAFDIDKERQLLMPSLGVNIAATPAEASDNSEIIILALPNSEIVENVMFCEAGILSSIKPGSIVIDTSSCRPTTAIKLESACNEKGADFIDAPLTRRGEGHILMVGGKIEAYNAAKEILDYISYKHQLVGSVGSGQIVKKIQQAVSAGVLAVYAENFELTKQCGLDPKLLKELLEFDIPDVFFTEDYSGGGNLAMHYKDLGYLNEVAHDKCANIPISTLIHEIFKAVHISGEPDWIQAGIQTYFKNLNTGLVK